MFKINPYLTLFLNDPQSNFLFVSGSMLPFFPEKVDNVTVKIGQNAELKCKVENLNNYKVFLCYYPENVPNPNSPETKSNVFNFSSEK